MTTDLKTATKADLGAMLKNVGIVLTVTQIKKTPRNDLARQVADIQSSAKSKKAKPAAKTITVQAKRDFLPFRPNTKQHAIFDLLRQPGGATLDNLREVTGWKDGSIKSAFYLDFAKLHGVGVRTDIVDDVAHYHAVFPKASK